MEKLVERESARAPLVAAPALAVQFFLIPLAVVGITVLVYVGFRSLLTEQRSAQEYLADIQNGGMTRQWPAAYELSRLMSDPKVRADKSLAPALVKAYEAARDGDPRVRRYLALAMGRLDPPLSADAIAALASSIEEPAQAWNPDLMSRMTGWSEIDIGEARISAIWALGSSGDAGVVPKLTPLYASPDAGVRKMVVYALGALPGDAQRETLQQALQDPVADVRWNSAIALARHGRGEGVPVLRQMLDRGYVERHVKREVRADLDQDPVADVMISGLRAVATLRDASLKPSVEGLSQQDRSLKVRQAALEALRVMG